MPPASYLNKHVSTKPDRKVFFTVIIILQTTKHNNVPVCEYTRVKHRKPRSHSFCKVTQL